MKNDFQAAISAGTRFLVTGGAGFIGSNLCEALLRAGMRVTCMDNLSTGFIENVNMFMDHPNYTFSRGDIQSIADCEKAADGIEFVLHQAALGSVPRSVKEPLRYERNNIMGTLNMLEAAKRRGVKRFVYASSSSVYGDDETLPKKEGKEGKILSPYALTKKGNEEYASLYTRLYGLETVGLRYFNVFGRRQSPDGEYAAVLPRFIGSLLRGEAPVIFGDGLQSRDFTYIENVVSANLLSCAAPPESTGMAYNIACGERVTLLDAYEIIQSALGIRIVPVFAPCRAGDIRHSHADIQMARACLGYDPAWGFAAGIREAIPWYRKSMGGKDA